MAATKRKITMLVLSVIMALTLCVGLATMFNLNANAADGGACVSTTDCAGTYSNGFCLNSETHYEPATLNNNGTADDTSDDYDEISNAGQLYWFMEHVNAGGDNVYANAVLTADIVVNDDLMSKITVDGDGNVTVNEYVREWFPIGYWYDRDGIDEEEDVYYQGIFDGQGHTISGLYFHNSEQDMVGLFGQINQGAVVKNVGVINSYISGGSIVSGVVGGNYGGTVENCYNTGSVSGVLGVSGVVCDNSVGTVKNCYNSGIISGTGNCVAGVAGFNSATIENCYNTSSISGNSLVGGIVGNNSGIVKSCYNIGTVSGTTANVGGVVGSNNGTVTNCYYLDKVGDTANPGGITGKDVEKSAESKTAEQFAFGEVAYLLNGSTSNGDLAWGQMLSDEDKDASPVFKTDHNTVYYGYISCADDATMVYSNNSAATAEKPAHDLRDGTGFCSVCDGYEPATLNNNGTADDTSDDYYEISNAGQLYWFMEYVNAAKLLNDQGDADATNDVYSYHANAVLTADIVVNDDLMSKITVDGDGNVTVNEDVREWFPIGYYYDRDGNGMQDVYYKGIFDGQGHTVSGLYFNNSKQSFVGLFGQSWYGAIIQNVGVIHSYISGDFYVGGVGGANGGTVENCYNMGDVSGNNSVGGVVGGNNGTVKNCYNTGNVSGNERVGGVGGVNLDTVTNCYYLKDTATNGIGRGSGDTTEMTADEFASGKVAYLLNGSKSVAAEGETLAWYQVLGANGDSFPVLTPVYDDNDNITNIVYQASPCKVYSNTVWTTEVQHNFNDNGFCSVCDAYEPATLNNNGTENDTADDYYEIGNAGQLYWFMEHVNANGDNVYANAVLTADIVVNEDLMSKITVDGDGNATVNEGEYVREWFPIGYWYDRDGIDEEENVFYQGIFDGHGHTVSGLYLNNSNQSYVGLFGQINDGAIIQNVGVIHSYISGSSIVGGVVGCNYGGTVENCYNMGDVSGNNSVGGVVGYNHNGTVKNCYYLIGTATNGMGYGSGDTTEMTAEQFASGEVAYLLNGSKSVAEEGETLVWGQTLSGNGRDLSPVFLAENGSNAVYSYTNCVGATAYANENLAEGSHSFDDNGFCLNSKTHYEPATLNNNGTENDTSDDYYEIGNAGQLYWFMEHVNAGGVYANAVLTADIVINDDLMSKITVDDDGNVTVNEGEYVREWFPIGYFYDRNGDGRQDVSYQGIFDGQGHTVSGLYFNNSSQSCVGLFGQSWDGAIIQNVGVIHSYISGDGRVGGVVGYNYYGTVTNCYNTGSVSGNDYYVGGVVGYNDGAIENCYNTGDVGGTGSWYVGGVVGYNNDTVTNCYNTGTVSGSMYVGDVVAVFSSGTMTNCYYLADSDDGYGGKTTAQFASGEVAYLLNGSKSVAAEGKTLAWGQTLSGDNKDAFPVFKTDSNTVYYGYISCADDATMVYSNNSAATAEKPEHKDENTDHICDNNCGKKDIAMDQHIDANLDHACDYGCDDTIGEHVDTNKDHACDYGCDETIGEHVDANKDHICDYGCAVAVSEHAYDNACDADCNICGEARTPAEHHSENADGKCDECGEKFELSGGAIAGITVGSVAILGGGGFAVYWFIFKKKKIK